MEFASTIKDERLLRAINELEWEELTPVQEGVIPLAREGLDLMAQAQTGTGKTGAFAIPIIEKLEPKKTVQCLVLTPTRELAMQVAGDFADLAKYVGVRAVPIYGGQSINVQTDKIRKGAEIIVGTPGRLMDLMRRGELTFDGVKYLVLDEADRMLDMGFIDDIEWILGRVPKQRQTMLFSATLPETIRELAQRYMRKPRDVIVSQDTLTVPQAEQAYISVGRKNKLWALCRILDAEKPELAMVFCSTKRMVDTLARKLRAYGYSADAIHGDLTQAARDKVMQKFRSGKLRVLIATDVAARGLDIEDVSHVFNWDIPENPEDYVHRIGRTARAGKSGKAITFVSQDEQHLVKAIEAFGRTKLEAHDVPQSKGRDTVKRQLDFDEYADNFGMVPFRINVGKRDGVGLVDLLKFIERKTGIIEHLIGNVDIGEESSSIELHKSVAFRAMKDLEHYTLGNKRVRLDLIRERPRR
ncbi:MAG: DEAD/DEAH box helicase [Candidatus Thermoplasmatota archaeon]|nr:DEAD/DEAH box helicase [Candidatus Thermoplasmatota archaeon]